MPERIAPLGLLAALLAGCGGGGGGTSAAPVAADPPVAVITGPVPNSDTEPTPDTATETVNRLPGNPVLPCLTPELVEEIRGAVSRMPEAFLACETDLMAATSHLALTLVQQQATFAMLVSHAMAPYGQSSALSLADLLLDDVLDCNNYGLLSGHLAAALGLSLDHWLMAGFDGGAVGNHAQVLLTLEGRTLLLDPTIGLVADISYDELVAGTPIDTARMAWIYLWDDPEIVVYSARVMAAIRDGSYRAVDQIYLYGREVLVD